MINVKKKRKQLVPALQITATGFALFFLCAAMPGCRAKKIVYTPQGYDITRPEKRELGYKLKEISGISWLNDSFLLAESDATGKIFAISLHDKNNVNYPRMSFGPKDDYEDIVQIDTTAYLLISDGKIVEVPGYARADKVPGSIVAIFGGEKNEFESLYYDKQVNSLIMLCKSCRHEKNEVRTAYRFDLATRKLIDTPYYQININIIRQKLGDPNAEFFPSAAAIQPVQRRLYILSSIGKMLVIADTKGRVLQAMRLNPSLFNQPEGITFAPNGDMYISNEAADDVATLLKFSYQP